MKRFSSLAIGGALAVALLSGCSSKADTTDFCNVATDWNTGGGPNFADLSTDAMTKAVSGDMSGINEWGKAASDQIDTLSADLKRAQKAAPSDDASKALDTILKGMDAVKTMTDAAATATDYDSFASAMQDGSDAITALEQDMSDAGDVLDKAAQDACS